jgi:hypothetical protein
LSAYGDIWGLSTYGDIVDLSAYGDTVEGGRCDPLILAGAGAVTLGWVEGYALTVC